MELQAGFTRTSLTSPACRIGHQGKMTCARLFCARETLATETTTVTLRAFHREGALFLGPLPPARRHTHAAIQGCVALQAELRVELDDRPVVRARAMLIASDVAHGVAAEGPVAHFYVAPGSATGARLAARLGSEPVMKLPHELAQQMASLAGEALADESRLPTLYEPLIALVLRDGSAPAPTDPRVHSTLAAIRHARHDPDAPGLDELARRVGLSPDRLRHLVRDEVGVPLRRYRRWSRLVHALDLLRSGASVTAAAVEAGFADAAHLSRVFREAFTFSPSAYARDSRFVQAPPEGSD